jgi:hypothetical protein
MSLVMPILLSAVLVFIVSSLVHTVLPYHRQDFRALPQEKEEEVRAVLRRLSIPPGDYMAPSRWLPDGTSQPAFADRMKAGPSVLMNVAAGGPMSMGKNLVQWFVYTLVVSLFAAYIASRALGVGAEYLDVFRFVGTSAFMGYSLALAQQSIWFRRNWASTLKSMGDGLLYALLTAGAFGWLWPR